LSINSRGKNPSNYLVLDTTSIRDIWYGLDEGEIDIILDFLCAPLVFMLIHDSRQKIHEVKRMPTCVSFESYVFNSLISLNIIPSCTHMKNLLSFRYLHH